MTEQAEDLDRSRAGAAEPVRPSGVEVIVMASFWWSRGDHAANLDLATILRRGDHLRGDIADPAAVDAALQQATLDPVVLEELGEWCGLASAR